MRHLTSVSVITCVVALLLACAGADRAKQRKDDTSPVAKEVKTLKRNEWYKYGDTQVTITEAVSSDNVAGQHYGQYATFKATFVRIEVKNTSAGKIADWKGQQGVATITDEHGNKFAALSLSGWSWLPFNEPHGNLGGDFGSKVAPGTTYENALYYAVAPATSKTLSVTLTIEDQPVRFVCPNALEGK